MGNLRNGWEEKGEGFKTREGENIIEVGLRKGKENIILQKF